MIHHQEMYFLGCILFQTSYSLFRNTTKSQVWWCTPLISALRKWRQKEQIYKVTFSYIEFENSLAYSRAYLKTKTKILSDTDWIVIRRSQGKRVPRSIQCKESLTKLRLSVCHMHSEQGIEEPPRS